MKKNGMFLATVCKYNGNKENPAKLDSNDLMPVILEPLGGTCPKKRVLAGTIARNMGIEENQVYLFKWTRLEDDEEYGSQFGFVAVTHIQDPIQVITASTSLGDSTIIE